MTQTMNNGRHAAFEESEAPSVQQTQAAVNEFVSNDELEKLLAVELRVKKCSPEAMAKLGMFEAAVTMARAINELRELISPGMMKEIMALQGSNLGFRTDMDTKDGYHPDAVKDCAIEAILKGARLVGNEFNIIAGKAYLTKEFFERAVKEYPGLSDLKLTFDMYDFKGGGAIVPVKVEWRLGSKPDSIETKIPVKVNNGMGGDAILGKAKRKILKQVHDRLTGSFLSDGDVDGEAVTTAGGPQVEGAAPGGPAAESGAVAANRQLEKVKGLLTPQGGAVDAPRAETGTPKGETPRPNPETKEPKPETPRGAGQPKPGTGAKPRKSDEPPADVRTGDTNDEDAQQFLRSVERR